MSAEKHTTLQDLFAAVRSFVQEHPGASVVCADDPWERTVGWSVSKVDGELTHARSHSIGLTQLKREIALLDAHDPLVKELLTVEGRQRIAESLARPMPSPSELRE